MQIFVQIALEISCGLMCEELNKVVEICFEIKCIIYKIVLKLISVIKPVQ